MTEYYRTVFDDDSLGRVERLWAINKTGSVKRTVDFFDDQTSRANSIAILSHRSGQFAEFAWSSDDPCLFAHAFKSVSDWLANQHQSNSNPTPIAKALFEQSFRRAKPDIQDIEP